uniref:Uncharacterized protein n=1 Tax=Anguilla anguilla TaxID=7936 RepID=A0A0E9QJJ1_ANGAN
MSFTLRCTTRVKGVHQQSCTHFISDRISICGYTEQVFCNKLRNHAQLYSLN